MKYIVKDFEDVFRHEFVQWIGEVAMTSFEKIHMQQIMNEVSKFEIREGLEFVSFRSDQFIIFRQAQ